MSHTLEQLGSTFQTLTVGLDGGVATLTLNRPSALNALNMTLKREIAAAVAAVAAEPAVRAVVLTGAGKAFCAGGDIIEMELNTDPATSRRRLQSLLAETFIPLYELEKPTIAAVNGHAHGAGLSLALACDLVYAAETASMSCAFTKMGLVPDCGSLYILPRLLPMGRVKELVYTGRRFTAAEAVDLGLVIAALPADELVPTVHDLARQLAAGAGVALGLTKALLGQSTSSTLREISAAEALAQAVTYASEDHLSARTAFAAKQVPVFHGR